MNAVHGNADGDEYVEKRPRGEVYVGCAGGGWVCWWRWWALVRLFVCFWVRLYFYFCFWVWCLSYVVYENLEGRRPRGGDRAGFRGQA